MKKTLAVISALTLLTGCNPATQIPVTQPTLQIQATQEITQQTTQQTTLQTFTWRQGISFNYPLGWQILHRGFLEENQPDLLQMKLKRYDATYINFNRPHDIGPYDYYPDVSIDDFVFEKSITAEDLLNREQQSATTKGTIQDFVSPQGVKFKVLHVTNLGIEADFVMYAASYADATGEHLVLISRMGSGYDKLEKDLKPLIDTFKLPAPTAPTASTKNPGVARVTATYCTDKAVLSDIGSYHYPVDPKYARAGSLGTLFTAYKCGPERMKEVMGSEEDNYDGGSSLTLYSNPYTSLIKLFHEIGYKCIETNFDQIIDDESCQHWKLTGTVKIKELLKLEPYNNRFEQEDCVNCG